MRILRAALHAGNLFIQGSIIMLRHINNTLSVVDTAKSFCLQASSRMSFGFVEKRISKMRYTLNRKTIRPQYILFYVGIEKVYDDQFDDGEVYVVMCPADYFAQYNCVYDQHLGIGRLLPEGMGECGECLFDTDKSVEDTYAALIALGFVEDPKFSQFCSQHDPFV